MFWFKNNMPSIIFYLCFEMLDVKLEWKVNVWAQTNNKTTQPSNPAKTTWLTDWVLWHGAASHTSPKQGSTGVSEKNILIRNRQIQSSSWLDNIITLQSNTQLNFTRKTNTTDKNCSTNNLGPSIYMKILYI